MKLLLLVVALAQPPVAVVKGGQFFHRPGHLMVDDVKTVSLEQARKDGFTACPECGVEAYFKAMVKERAREKAAVPPRVILGLPAAAPAVVPEVVAPPPAAPRFELPADGLPVPGTGGLLKVPTFKGSGGIIAVPLPMGGYTVVEPPFTTGPAAPPAGDPAPSAR